MPRGSTGSRSWRKRSSPRRRLRRHDRLRNDPERSRSGEEKGAGKLPHQTLDFDELSGVVDRAMEKARLLQDAPPPRPARERTRSVTSSPRTRRCRSSSSSSSKWGRAGRASSSPARAEPVKELIAEAIHRPAPRAKAPFVRLHCAAPRVAPREQAVRHERGHSTARSPDEEGRFKQADGGTLLLDQIGEIPLATQVKLPRFLQERTFERVGGNETLKVDARIIAATNRDLKAEIKRPVSRGPLLPPQRRDHRATGAARTSKRRRAPRDLLLRRYAAENGKTNHGFSGQRGDVHRLRMAREREGARELHRARGRPVRHDPQIERAPAGFARPTDEPETANPGSTSTLKRRRIHKDARSNGGSTSKAR